MSISTILGASSNWQVATSAAHLALRLIRFRAGAERMIGGLRKEADENEAAGLALRVIEDIERSEHRPLADLTEDQAEGYARTLSEVSEDRAHAALPADIEKSGLGEAALQRLRRLY